MRAPPNGLIGDVEPTFGEQFLDVVVAQGEAEINPDRVLDDLGRKVMTAPRRPKGIVTTTVSGAGG